MAASSADVLRFPAGACFAGLLVAVPLAQTFEDLITCVRGGEKHSSARAAQTHDSHCWNNTRSVLTPHPIRRRQRRNSQKQTDSRKRNYERPTHKRPSLSRISHPDTAVCGPCEIPKHRNPLSTAVTIVRQHDSRRHTSDGTDRNGGNSSISMEKKRIARGR